MNLHSIRSALVTGAALLGGVAVAPAQLPGTSVYATGSSIWVQFVSADAWFDSDLYLFSYVSDFGNPDPGSGTFLFGNHSASTDPILVNGFTAGDEVIFAIMVRDQLRDTEEWYFSGGAERNPDQQIHVRFWATGDDTFAVRIGFEDLYGGGDRDFNDLIFNVAGVSAPPTITPEPITVLLLGSGLLGIGGAGAVRRRRQAQES